MYVLRIVFSQYLSFTYVYNLSNFFQDASDPDLDLPNKIHLLQTAEGIRRAGYVHARMRDDASF
jgi:hypothetical protein